MSKTELNSSKTREITDEGEIQQILQAALVHEWPFFYLSMVRNHLTSHSTELYSIDRRAGTITVNSDILEKLPESLTNTVFFRTNNGGISIVFKSTLAVPCEGTSSDSKPAFCEFEFPESLQYSQQRKAMRINLKNLQEIPVILFTSPEARYHGRIVDISETGAKLVFEGDLTGQLSGSEIITDCQMRFFDETCIENRIRVLGVVCDQRVNLSYLRCEYAENNMTRDVQIKQLIADASNDKNQRNLAFVG